VAVEITLVALLTVMHTPETPLLFAVTYPLIEPPCTNVTFVFKVGNPPVTVIEERV
jgi:hypothetical protein